MVGGILLLSEYPTPVGIAGLVLIVVGSYWILGAEKKWFSVADFSSSGYSVPYRGIDSDGIGSCFY